SHRSACPGSGLLALEQRLQQTDSERHWDLAKAWGKVLATTTRSTQCGKLREDVETSSINALALAVPASAASEEAWRRRRQVSSEQWLDHPDWIPAANFREG
ncbi:unnamed protein product, partial [Polarella glacialis]